MPTTQNRNAAMAFRHTGTYAVVGAQAAYAARPATQPQQEAPSAAKAVRPRHQVQAAWITLILVAAIGSVTLGLAYLSACASVTREGYRKARLKTMLRQEREKAQYWRELRGQVMTPASIEQRAKVHGLLRADEKNTVSLP
jgi:hypothetical protein